VERIRE